MEYLTLNSFETKRSVTIDSLKTHFLPIQEGEGDPSPDNIRPITGWNSIKVRKCGKNLAKIVGYSAITNTSVESLRPLTNNYGTAISTINYSDELIITQSNYPDTSNLRSYKNGYFTVVFDNLPFNKAYNISFKISNITSNPLNAMPSNISISNPNGNIFGATIATEDGHVIFENINYRRNTSYPGRCGFSIYNCGMSFTLSEFMVTAVEDDDFTYEPYREEEVEVELHGKNLVPSIDEWQDGYVNGNGTIGSPANDQNEKYCNCIKVSPNAPYIFSFSLTNTPSKDLWGCIATYDKDKNLIRRYSYNPSLGTESHQSIITEENCNYIACSFRTFNMVDWVQLEKVEVNEVLNKKSKWVDGYISSNPSVPVSPDTTRKEITSDFIDIGLYNANKIGFYYSFNNVPPDNNWVGVVFCDENKSYLSRPTKFPGTNLISINGFFEIPEDARYIRFSFRSYGDVKNISVFLCNDSNVTYEPYANTFYGGYVDITKGELVQEWEAVSSTWGDIKRSNQRNETTGYYIGFIRFNNFIEPIHTSSAYGVITLCNTIGKVSWNLGDITPEHYYGGNDSTSGCCYVFGDWNDDLEIQIAAKLLTPIHYPIPPETLKTLRGFNTIFSTGNDSIEVGYSELSPMSLLELRRSIIASEPHLVTVETGNTEDSDVIASFKTNTALPINSMITNFEPKQDLNGYPNPFPAGRGSNILEVSAEKHFTSNSASYNNWTELDNVLTITGNCQGGYLVSCEPNTTYTYSFKCDTNYKNRFHARVWEGTEDPITALISGMMTVNIILNTVSEAVFTFTTREDTVCLVVGFYVHNVESPITVTEMQLETGSTATKYNAYGSSNICPITGMDELEIHNYPHLAQWNQWLQPLTEEHWRAYDTSNNTVTFSEDGMATNEWLNTRGGYSSSIRNKVGTPQSEGQVWYVSYMVRHHGQDIKYFGVECCGGRQFRSVVAAEPENWYQVSVVTTYNRGTKNYVYIANISDAVQVEAGLTADVKAPIHINLTQMYGAGNEPTKEEFEAQCALNGIDLTTYNSYDEGTVIPWRTSADEDIVYQIPLTLPNLITPEPKSITSYNVDFTVNEDGTVDYEGTPTSYADVAVGYYYVKGGETITVTICGDNANLCFNAQHLYDSNRNRISFPKSVNNYEGRKTYTIDLSEYPDAYLLKIYLKRHLNDIYMKGRCWVRVVEGTVDTGDEVFGGYVDLDNNEFVKTWECVGLDSLNWGIWCADINTYPDATPIFRYTALELDISTEAKDWNNGITWYVSGLQSIWIRWGTNITSYSVKNYPEYGKDLSFTITQSGSRGWLAIRADQFDNVADLKRFLQGKKVAYPKEVPVHFPLSPTVIRTLKGMNNIYTNANGKSIIKYWTH